MSKAYEETMLTLTLAGAVFKILKNTFSKGAKLEDFELFIEVNTIYKDIRKVTKKWPHQDNNKAVNAIIDKTNTIIRNHKHLQGQSVFITTLTSMVIARMSDLYVKVNGIKKEWINDLLSQIEKFNSKIESAISDGEDIEEQYEIGSQLYEDLN